MVMRTMRNNLGILKWMFVLLLFVFGIGLVLPSANSRDLASAAAVVDGKPVSANRYSKVVQSRLENERLNLGGELSEGDSLRVRRSTLEELIEEELALGHAGDLGQKSSEEEFREAVINDPTFKDPKTGAYAPERYQQLLQMQAQQGMDWKEAEETFMRGMLLQKVRNFFSSQAVLSPAESAAAVSKFNRQVRSQAAVWDLAKLKSSQKLTDEEIRVFYSENKQRWAKPEQFKLRQILVKTDFAVSTTTAKAKAEGLLAKLKAGADFKALAKAENADQASKDNGGDLGWVTREEMDSMLGSEAARLKPGQLSPVITTAQGFHILKLEDKKAGFEPTLANSQAKAKDELAAKRASKEANMLAHQALADVKAGLTVEAAAKKHNGSVVTTGWYGRDSTSALAVLGKNSQFAEEQLSLDKGEAPESPIVTDKAAVFAVVIDEKAGPAPAKPADAQARSRAALAAARNKRADQLYKAWVTGLRKNAKVKDQMGVLAAVPETDVKK